MHIPTGKNDAKFQQEFDRILEEAGHGLADFTRFVFPSANYKNRRFEAKCDFLGAVFKQEADFVGATFVQTLDLRGASFESGAHFAGTRFMLGSNFVAAKFRGLTSFSGAHFTKATEFTWARFAADALFHKSEFHEDAQFHGASFENDADFSEAIFDCDANFYGATFRQDVKFNASGLAGWVDFSRAKFLGAAEFLETSFRRDHDRGPGPVFSLAEFSRPEAVIFYKTYLGQALFHNCNVSKLAFVSAEWRRRKRSGKRTVFEEDVDLSDKAASALKPKDGSADERDYQLIEGLYQQLKKNYDEAKDYWTAGDFHYGEMEMKRLHSQSMNQLVRWLHRNLGLTAWYKYASAYGESYVRPVALLLIALAIFTVLFPWAGLDQSQIPPRSVTVLAAQPSPPSATISELSYRHLPDFVGAYDGRKWVAPAAFFGNSLMTALSVAGFQKELKYEPNYPWGRALALLEVLLTSALAALFLLAIRRQFRR